MAQAQYVTYYSNPVVTSYYAEPVTSYYAPDHRLLRSDHVLYYAPTDGVLRPGDHGLSPVFDQLLHAVHLVLHSVYVVLLAVHVLLCWAPYASYYVRRPTTAAGTVARLVAGAIGKRACAHALELTHSASRYPQPGCRIFLRKLVWPPPLPNLVVADRRGGRPHTLPRP